jgi:hypothetical protein
MPFNPNNPVNVGDATRKSAYDRVFLNTIALKEARLEHHLGGDVMISVADAAYVPLPGVVVLELDGTNLSGLTIEVHAMCRVAAAGTGRFRLWNITTGGEVSGSETTFTETTATLKKSAPLTVATGINQYRVEVRGTTLDVERPCVYGAKLVIR